MSRKFLCVAFGVLTLVALSLPADAGRRHRRSHSSACGPSAGAWYHFTSGGGSYVPFASQPVTTSPGVNPAWGSGMTSTCAAPSTSSWSSRPSHISPAVHHSSSGHRMGGW